jgi:hypothetical protein
MADDVAYGQQRPNDTNDETAVAMFLARQLISEMSTMKLVKVTKVTGGGEGEPAGTVEVQPLVSQIDGNGYGTEHGIVPDIPWSRIQGGSNAIICDPQVDDIGYVVVSDRDISKVKATRAAALPGSRRQYDLADGVYVGGCLNVAPEQYLVFTANGIRIVDKNGTSLALESGGFALTDSHGNVISTGAGGITITPAAGGTVTIHGKVFETHAHTGVTTGGGISGPPA